MQEEEEVVSDDSGLSLEEMDSENEETEESTEERDVELFQIIKAQSKPDMTDLSKEEALRSFRKMYRSNIMKWIVRCEDFLNSDDVVAIKASAKIFRKVFKMDEELSLNSAVNQRKFLLDRDITAEDVEDEEDDADAVEDALQQIRWSSHIVMEVKT